MAQKKAKSSPAKETPEVTPKEIETPQLTFTEEEHKSLVEYLNFIDEHASYHNVKDRQIQTKAVLNIKVANLAKKIESHIFEFKKRVPAPQKEAK